MKIKKVMHTLEQNPVIRLLLVIIIVMAGFGIAWVVNFIVHGSGAQERQLMEAVATSYAEKNISGTIAVKSKAQGTDLVITGNYGLKNQSDITAAGKVSGTYQGLNLDMPIEYRNTKDASYLKLTNLGTLVQSMGQAVASYKDTIDPVIAKTDGRWIKIPAQKNVQTECTINILKKISTDKSVRDDVTNIYIMNRFLRVTGKKTNDTNATELFVSADEQATRSFVSAIKSKKFFKETPSCDQSYNPLPESNPQQADKPQVTNQQPISVKIVIDSRGHIKDIESNNGSSSLLLTLQYDKAIDVDVPTDTISSEEIQRDLAPLSSMAGPMGMQQMQPGMMGGR